jgi:ubiquitin carboxyl-terminal hydrolase L5
MPVAIDNIKQHIEEYQQDGVQFNLLSLCRSPLCSIPEKIATSIHARSLIRKFLTKLQPSWQQFSSVDESNLVNGPAKLFGVSPELLGRSTLSKAASQRIDEATMDPAALLNLYVEYATDQIQLQALYMEEDALIDQENQHAEQRKQDHTSLIYNAFKTLAEKGVLKEIVKEVSEQ